MVSRYSQRGMSMWSLLGILVLIGFAALVAVKLTPVYLNYWSVASVVESVIEDTGRNDPMPEVWDKLVTRFDLNNISQLDAREILDVKRSDGGLQIDVQYEQRKNLVYNVALVVSFDRTFGP